MTKFCSRCDRVMVLNFETGNLIHHCTSCFETVEGSDQDTLLYKGQVRAQETIDKYSRLSRNLAFDPTNQKVHKECPKCGLDLMVQAFIGENDLVIYKCDCEKTKIDASNIEDIANAARSASKKRAMAAKQKAAASSDGAASAAN